MPFAYTHPRYATQRTKPLDAVTMMKSLRFVASRTGVLAAPRQNSVMNFSSLIVEIQRCAILPQFSLLPIQGDLMLDAYDRDDRAIAIGCFHPVSQTVR